MLAYIPFIQEGGRDFVKKKFKIMKSILNKKKKRRMRNFTLCKTNPVWGLNVKEVWIILVAKFNGIKHAARIKCKKLCDEKQAYLIYFSYIGD